MEKSEFKSLKEWKKTNPSAYNAAYNKGIVEDICNQFGWTNFKLNPKGYWTKQRCKKDALKYKTKKDWYNNSTGYQIALKNNWISYCCKHMKTKRQSWSLELCKKEALKYSSEIEWRKKHPSSYTFAYRKKYLIECCKHMTNKRMSNGYWTLNTCKKDALKYNNKTEWRLSSSGAYNTAYKNDWLKKCCKHMVEGRKHNYWTLMTCKKDALKYKKRTEWQKKSSSAYHKARSNNWLDECCNHMMKNAKF